MKIAAVLCVVFAVAFGSQECVTSRVFPVYGKTNDWHPSWRSSAQAPELFDEKFGVANDQSLHTTEWAYILFPETSITKIHFWQASGKYMVTNLQFQVLLAGEDPDENDSWETVWINEFMGASTEYEFHVNSITTAGVRVQCTGPTGKCNGDDQWLRVVELEAYYSGCDTARVYPLIGRTSDYWTAWRTSNDAPELFDQKTTWANDQAVRVSDWAYILFPETSITKVYLKQDVKVTSNLQFQVLLDGEDPESSDSWDTIWTNDILQIGREYEFRIDPITTSGLRVQCVGTCNSAQHWLRVIELEVYDCGCEGSRVFPVHGKTNDFLTSWRTSADAPELYDTKMAWANDQAVHTSGWAYILFAETSITQIYILQHATKTVSNLEFQVLIDGQDPDLDESWETIWINEFLGTSAEYSFRVDSITTRGVRVQCGGTPRLCNWAEDHWLRIRELQVFDCGDEASRVFPVYGKTNDWLTGWRTNAEGPELFDTKMGWANDQGLHASEWAYLLFPETSITKIHIWQAPTGVVSNLEFQVLLDEEDPDLDESWETIWVNEFLGTSAEYEFRVDSITTRGVRVQCGGTPSLCNGPTDHWLRIIELEVYDSGCDASRVFPVYGKTNDWHSSWRTSAEAPELYDEKFAVANDQSLHTSEWAYILFPETSITKIHFWQATGTSVVTNLEFQVLLAGEDPDEHDSWDTIWTNHFLGTSDELEFRVDSITTTGVRVRCGGLLGICNALDHWLRVVELEVYDCGCDTARVYPVRGETEDYWTAWRTSTEAPELFDKKMAYANDQGVRTIDWAYILFPETSITKVYLKQDVKVTSNLEFQVLLDGEDPDASDSWDTIWTNDILHIDVEYEFRIDPITTSGLRVQCVGPCNGDGQWLRVIELEVYDCVNDCEPTCDANAGGDASAGTCTCNEGWSGDGLMCKDIDECENETCDDRSHCVNNDGSFQCDCNEGFIKDDAGLCSAGETTFIDLSQIKKDKKVARRMAKLTGN